MREIGLTGWCGALDARRVVDGARSPAGGVGPRERYELLRSEIRTLGDLLGRYKAETYAARAEVHRTGAAVFGAGRLVLVTVWGRMGKVPLLGEMHGVFKDFSQTRDESPQEQRRDSDCCEAFHEERM